LKKELAKGNEKKDFPTPKNGESLNPRNGTDVPVAVKNETVPVPVAAIVPPLMYEDNPCYLARLEQMVGFVKEYLHVDIDNPEQLATLDEKFTSEWQKGTCESITAESFDSSGRKTRLAFSEADALPQMKAYAKYRADQKKMQEQEYKAWQEQQRYPQVPYRTDTPIPTTSIYNESFLPKNEEPFWQRNNKAEAIQKLEKLKANLEENNKYFKDKPLYEIGNNERISEINRQISEIQSRQ